MDQTKHPDGSFRTLILLSFTLLLSMSTWFSASAVLADLRENWNLSPTASTWLTIAVQLGFVLGAVVSSLINLSDILSARYVILIGSVGAAAVNLLVDFTNIASLGILLRFATGFFLAGVYPPAFKLISTWYRKGRGMALGIMAAALVLGNGLPHLINGLGGLNWHLVIYITSAITLLGGLIAVIAIKDGPYPFPKAIFNPKQAGKVIANKGVRLASIGYIGHMWELFGLYAWYYVFITVILTDRGWTNVASAAFATFGLFAAGSLGSWAGGFIAVRWGKMKTTILMMAISGSCAILIGLLIYAPIWIIFLVSLIWGFAVVADSAQFSTMVTEMADQSYVGTALTLQLAAGFSITVVTIWLIPFLVEQITWRWAFALLAPGPAVGILAMLRLQYLHKLKLIADENEN